MLVSPNHNHRLGPIQRSALAVETLAAYAQVRRLLHSRSPAETVEMLRRPRQQHAQDRSARDDLVIGWRLGHAVTVTLGPLPTDVRCLFRSLTLMSLMERRGIHPELVIAVRPKPFAAHAWIELDGRPLLPSADPDYDRLAEL